MNITRFISRVAPIALGLLIATVPAVTPAQDNKRAITKLTGDVYRFQNNFHFSVFAITGEGVVVSDPINEGAAAWLRTEIAKMTAEPITHLVYSHSHGDHASGGKAFGDGLTVIAHQNAPEAIDGVKPTIRFDGTHQFKVGSKTFELTALGPGHGDDLIAMVIRPENVLFVVDAVSAARVPYRDFPGVDINGLINQIKTVESLNFDVMAPGHGALGTKADATTQREYVLALQERVTDAIAKGADDNKLVTMVPMSEYKDWGSYKAWHPLNVKGMANWLRKSGAVK